MGFAGHENNNRYELALVAAMEGRERSFGTISTRCVQEKWATKLDRGVGKVMAIYSYEEPMAAVFGGTPQSLLLCRKCRLSEGKGGWSRTTSKQSHGIRMAAMTDLAGHLTTAEVPNLRAAFSMEDGKKLDGSKSEYLCALSSALRGRIPARIAAGVRDAGRIVDNSISLSLMVPHLAPEPPERVDITPGCIITLCLIRQFLRDSSDRRVLDYCDNADAHRLYDVYVALGDGPEGVLAELSTIMAKGETELGAAQREDILKRGLSLLELELSDILEGRGIHAI